MTDFTRGLDRRTFIFGAAALGAATLLRPTLAFAEPTSCLLYTSPSPRDS